MTSTPMKVKWSTEGDRPYVSSILKGRDTMFVDKAMIRTINYNKILFAALRYYYDDYGWYMLTKYYISMLYTFEYELHLIGIDKCKLMDMREYANTVISPIKFKKLTKEDTTWFEYAVPLLEYAIKAISKRIREVNGGVHNIGQPPIEI